VKSRGNGNKETKQRQVWLFSFSFLFFYCTTIYLYITTANGHKHHSHTTTTTWCGFERFEHRTDRDQFTDSSLASIDPSNDDASNLKILMESLEGEVDEDSENAGLANG
jgi:hypothetical protein